MTPLAPSTAVSTHLAPSPWDFIEQQARKHSPASFAPNDVLGKIFEYLPPEGRDLASAFGTCRVWKEAATEVYKRLDLQKLFPNLRILDGTTWQTHADCAALGLSVDDAPVLDQRTIILAVAKLYAAVEKNAGVTLLLMPQGLTFNKIVQLAGAPTQGNRVTFAHIWNRISPEFGAIAVAKTHWVAITNSVLQGSRNLSVERQQELATKKGCKMPGVLEATALAVLTYISSNEIPPTRLYNNSPCTYTRCTERIWIDNTSCRLVVGGFAPAGLNVGLYDYRHVGVAGLREFSNEENK